MRPRRPGGAVELGYFLPAVWNGPTDLGRRFAECPRGPLLRRDSEQTPDAVDPLEFVFTPVFEGCVAAQQHVVDSR